MYVVLSLSQSTSTSRGSRRPTTVWSQRTWTRCCWTLRWSLSTRMPRSPLLVGKTNTLTHTQTHRIKHLPYSPCTLKYPPTYRKYNKHTASNIVPHTSSPKSHTRIAPEMPRYCAQATVATAQDKNRWSNSSLYSLFVMEAEFHLSPLAVLNKWVFSEHLLFLFCI